MTARDLIRSSLRLIGAIAPGESLSATEASDALETLNSMLASMSNNSLLIYQSKKEAAITLVAGTSTYQLGSGGSITTRPMSIDYATISVGITEYPVDLLSEGEYASITIKSLQSAIPECLWDDGGYPTRTLYLFPVPSAANTLNLYTTRPLDSFASLDATVDLPPGYQRMLRYNLAIDLAPEYGRQVTPELATIAQESKADIKRSNFKPSYLKCDSAITGPSTFNINTGGWRK